MKQFWNLKWDPRFSGDPTERATPVPIPNTEVKPLRADGTARATAWETRSLPGLKNPDKPQGSSGFLLLQERPDHLNFIRAECIVRRQNRQWLDFAPAQSIERIPVEPSPFFS